MLELPKPNYALIFAICLLVIFVLIGAGVASWASSEYGSSSTELYVFIAAYTVTAFILFVVLMVLLGGFFENMNPNLAPPAPENPDEVDTATNALGPQGDQAQALFRLVAIGGVSYFVYKFMALQKAKAAKPVSSEGASDLMMYSSNGMD